jgi:MFS family permease
MNVKQLEGNIWKSYVFQILRGMFFSVPIMVLFWQENGLSLMEVMILQSLFSMTVVVLEIPTGYFADVFGRKKSLIVASFFGFIGFAIYSISYNFYQFLIAEILLAIAISFISGADSALLYDTLKDLKKENLYKKIYGNVLFYGLIGMSVASVIGGYVGEINLRWTLYLSLPFMALLIPLSFSLKEPKRHEVIFEKGYILELFKIIKTVVLKNKKIKWLIVYAGIIAGFNGAAVWFYQPYFIISGLEIAHFGIVFASFQIMAALSSKYAHKIEEILGQKFSLVLLIFLSGISYLLMSNFVYLFSFSFAFLQQFVRGFLRPIIEDYINKLISSEIRATVLSIQNMSGKLFYAFIIPIIGWVADAYTLTQALAVLGITTLAFGIFAIFMLRRARVV